MLENIVVSSAKAITRRGISESSDFIIKGSGVFSRDFNRGSRNNVHLSGAITLPWPRPHFLIQGAPAPSAVRTMPSLSLSRFNSKVISCGGNL